MNRVATVAAAVLLTPSSAWSFCGTYVGGAGAELYNNVAQVAIVRQGTRTTLSISNDVVGDTSSFALVLPVPSVLPEEDIHVLKPSVFDVLDSYSSPRLVRYECEDFQRDTGAVDFNDVTDTDVDSDTDSGVEVEAEYIVGEYQIVVLSATQSEGLFTWLNDGGYAVPEGSQPLLSEYIDAGAYFLAARVNEDANIASGAMLSPLQFSYDTSVFSLPIRIGTLNSSGTQDLVIYGINTYADGKVGISNYPEMEVEDECLWKPNGETFGEFYGERFDAAYAATEGASWATEYAWGGSGCDPCTGDPPDAQALLELGYKQPEWRSVNDVFFTRLHMRYTPEEANADLTLYHSRLQGEEQQRYIEHEEFLETRYPICVTGFASEPGSCGLDTGGRDTGGRDDSGDRLSREAGCRGCSTLPASGGLGLLGVLLLMGGLRRREDRSR